MRRLVLLLILIALVPLRTWAGDAMAIHMAAQAQSARAAAPAPTAHANCHEAQAEAAAAPQNDNTADPCASCAFCQACFTVAIALPAMPPAALALPHGQPQAVSAQFTSAMLALGHKPPIS